MLIYAVQNTFLVHFWFISAFNPASAYSFALVKNLYHLWVVFLVCVVAVHIVSW